MSNRTPDPFTILVIDRYEPILRLYATEFEEEGFDVMAAASIPEGVMLMTMRTPDLIIVDIREFDEKDTGSLLASENIIPAVPLIITWTSLPFPTQVSKVNAVDFVMKSSNLDELKEKVIKVCTKGSSRSKRKNRIPARIAAKVRS